MVVMEATAASRAEVDTSRPFRSVRQAVEVFGERYAGGGNGSSSNASSESSVKLSAPPAASSSMVLELDCLKKLEEDLAEAKGELVELRQRQAQMVVSMSSLSAQFSRGLAVFSGLGKGKEVAVVGARRRPSEKTSTAATVGSAATGGTRARLMSGWRAWSTYRACRRR